MGSLLHAGGSLLRAVTGPWYGDFRCRRYRGYRGTTDRRACDAASQEDTIGEEVPRNGGDAHRRDLGPGRHRDHSRRDAKPVYINDQPCYLRDGENNSVYVPTSHIVIWPNGKALLVCVAHDVSNPSRRLVRFDYDNSGGRLCGFEGGVTKDWTIVVTPRGTSTMVCWVR